MFTNVDKDMNCNRHNWQQKVEYRCNTETDTNK